MRKYLFIDRDGTLIVEPEDKQIDSVDKLQFMPGVFTALERLQSAGYVLILVSNQDGLGTESFPQADFEAPQELMLKVFLSQGTEFESILICPHFAEDNCSCRKPEIGLLTDVLLRQDMDKENSYVLGDRETDLQMAERLGCHGVRVTGEGEGAWPAIVETLLNKPRTATIKRETKETAISVAVNLDQPGRIAIATGNDFFDHMLEQIVKHAGFSADIAVKGDWMVDDHHSVEDTAIALGAALAKALGDKRGVGRFGFLLPMDESRAQIALDLSGRRFCQFEATFNRDSVGGISTEMFKHFFISFADGLEATLHIQVEGENTHHMVEVAFKGLGRTLKQAIARQGDAIPSTKGVL